MCRTGGGRGFFSSIGASGGGVLRWGLGKGTVGYWGERPGETGNGLMRCCALAGSIFFSDRCVHVKKLGGIYGDERWVVKSMI